MKKKAPSLKQGDVVAIVAPSGAVHKDSLDRGVEILKSLGYRVKMGKSVQKRYGYLAGNDIERAHDFMSAWTDPEVKAVLAARGGYGATRILPNLDFNVLRDHIKILVGFSDITALHLAFWREMRLVTFHGPMVESGTDSSLSVPYNLEGFRQILDGSWRGGELRMPDEAGKGSDRTRDREKAPSSPWKAGARRANWSAGTCRSSPRCAGRGGTSTPTARSFSSKRLERGPTG